MRLEITSEDSMKKEEEHICFSCDNGDNCKAKDGIDEKWFMVKCSIYDLLRGIEVKT